MLYHGPYRPLTKTDEVVADVVADAIARANESMERGQFHDALFDLDTALHLMPKLPHAHFNRSHALLSLGDYVEGFAEFEWRLPLFGDGLMRGPVPLWRGEDLDGKQLLLCHEHGYGDSLMMLRYVPVLKAKGAAITLLLPNALLRLARKLGADVLDEVPQLDRFDYYCPMFSVMAALGQRASNIPPPPYITTTAATRIAKGKTIGIAWSGNRTHLRDVHRSIDLDLFLSLLDHEGCELVSVQASEGDSAAERGVLVPVYRDFAEAAGMMQALDHIVTVDTAAAHLAGAIGHPSVHLLLRHVPDWRWYNAAAWYPNINVHRQDRPGDWPSAFAKVNRCLNA